MTPAVRIRLWVFLIIGGIAVVNAGARYAGLTDAIFPTTYQVSVQLKDSGGLFERGEVTYRGVTVGRVEGLEFRTRGVTATLAIGNQWKIPSDLTAEVHNRSAVGEQYVDLIPKTDHGPYLVDGSVIAENLTSTPVHDEDLIVATDQLLRSINTKSLATVVNESSAAFSGAGNDISRLLGNSETILNAARDALPQTVSLLHTAATVLATQNDEASTISTLVSNLVTVTGVFAVKDAAVRRVFLVGTTAARQLQALAVDLNPGLSTLLAPTLTLAQITAAHRGGLEETLIALPWALASAETPGRDGRAHFTFVDSLTPTPCRKGYIPAQDWHSPLDPTVSVLPPGLGCREPASVPRGVTVK
jgi:phospholipid/cholesterol/gamma-HCH transport system substrate-binding protein